MAIKFLSVAQVEQIHASSIANYGGDEGTRDRGLLESAVLTPQQKYAGAYLHPDLIQMAAAYLFHLCKNHPFVDGNKRTAAMTAIVFLDVNEYQFNATNEQLFELVVGVAGGMVEKPAVADFFQRFAQPRT